MADYNSSYTGTQIDQGVGIALDLNGHKTDTTVHITASERSTWNAKQAALTFDSTPTANSGNPVTSGGIKTALDAKADTGHTHSADDISGGTLPVERGGTGATSIEDTVYTTARYRASALVSADTAPTENGVINWTYA